MDLTKRKFIPLAALCAIFAAVLSLACPALARQTQQPSAPNPVAKRLGAIKAISGNTITLAPDKGTEVAVLVQDSTRILQIAPGQKDLSSATPAHLSDLQPGDRILVAGALSADGASLAASTILAMKRSDVEAKQQAERQAWQRGVGGLVKSVDHAAGAIAISVATAAGIQAVAVHVTPSTTFLRYAPNSVNFADAQPSSLDAIKPGDQLRARGMRSSDGTEIAADAIVSGSFRNISGAITSLDAAAGTITIADLISKHSVTVKFTSSSQLRKLPPEIAQRIAFRLKAASAQPGLPAGPVPEQSAGAAQRPAGGQFDFQQIVNRMPPVALADFQKGDAVMIVSTEGADAANVTAISLLGGVEPILTAAPAGSQAVTLSPWSLGSEPAGGDTQ